MDGVGNMAAVRAPRIHRRGGTVGFMKKKGRPNRAALLTPHISHLPLRRKTPERAADVAFAEPLERTVAQLADALARDAEH